MSLMAPATRFLAYGHPAVASAWSFSRPTWLYWGCDRSTTTPATSGRVANANSLPSIAGTVPPAPPVLPGCCSIRAASTKISDCAEPAIAAGAVPISATPEQAGRSSRLTSRAKGASVEVTPLRPLTRT